MRTSDTAAGSPKRKRQPRVPEKRKKAIPHYFDTHEPKNPVVAKQRQVFIEKCSSSPMLQIPRTYMLTFEDLHTALFVQHIAYLMERSQDPNGWVYHSNWHLSQELCFTEDRLNRIKTKLEALGILKVFYDRRRHRSQYALDPGVLRNFIEGKGIETGKEEVDFGVTKPIFLRTAEHSAESGIEINRQFLKGTPSLKGSPKGEPESALRAAESFLVEAPSAADTQLPTAPSPAPEAHGMPPEESGNAQPAPHPARSTAAEETPKQWDPSPDGHAINRLTADHPDGDIPWHPKGFNPGDGPRHTGSAVAVPDNDPVRIGVTYSNGHLCAQKCLQTAREHHGAEAFLSLFPGQTWDRASAKAFFRRWLSGKLSMGFIDYLRKEATAADLSEVMEFFDRKTGACKKHQSAYYRKIAGRREELAPAYVTAVADHLSNVEIVEKFDSVDGEADDYRPDLCHVNHVEKFAAKYPARFGSLILHTGVTWQEAREIDSRNGAVRLERRTAWQVTHVGRNYREEKDSELPAMLQRHNSKWGIGSDEEFEMVRGVVREFVIRNAWVRKRFDKVAPFWNLDIKEIRTAADVYIQDLASELEEFGWDPSQQQANRKP